MFASVPQIAVCSFEPGRGVIRNAGLATPQYEAGAKPWFRSGEVLTVNGAAYKRDGGPVMRFNVNFAAIEIRDGTPILAEGRRDEVEAAGDRPDTIYLLVSSRTAASSPM